MLGNPFTNGGPFSSRRRIFGASPAYFDYAGNIATGPGITDIASAHTITRASSGYAVDTAGTWTNFSSGVLRRTNAGLLVEESRTNRALWARDLTNAAWVKTSVTAALNQSGIDGAANAASSITATAGNGTVLQSITDTSKARAQSAFVRRLVGSGTIQMTMDGGTTWTNITVTASWAQVSIPTQTLANPSVGFRIVTSGDSIAVDFAQCEDGAFATSPILTTTAAATRAADIISVNNASAWLNPSLFSWTAEHSGPGPTSTDRRVFATRIDGSNTVHAGVDNATNRLRMVVTTGGSDQATILSANAVVAGTIYKLAGRVQSSNFGARFAGLGADPSDVTTGTAPTGLPTLWIGQGNSGVTPLNGYIRRLAFFNSALTNTELAALVA